MRGQTSTLDLSAGTDEPPARTAAEPAARAKHGKRNRPSNAQTQPRSPSNARRQSAEATQPPEQHKDATQQTKPCAQATRKGNAAEPAARATRRSEAPARATQNGNESARATRESNVQRSVAAPVTAEMSHRELKYVDITPNTIHER